MTTESAARSTAMTGDNTGTESLETRRKRLKFRSWHRGTREVDLIMGNFADRFIGDLTKEQLDRYEVLLDLPDLDVYNWVTGREPVPEKYDTDVVRLLLDFALYLKPAR